MRRKIGVLVFVIAATLGNGLRAGSLESLTSAEFQKLPDGVQAVYVAGVLDGMSYVTYNYSLPHHEDWAACVRTKTLGDTVTDVLTYLQNNPSEAKYPLPWAVAKTMGQRSCAPKPSE